MRARSIASLKKQVLKWKEKADALRTGLDESIQLQCRYAVLLNTYDGGERRVDFTVKSWLERLEEIEGDE